MTQDTKYPDGIKIGSRHWRSEELLHTGTVLLQMQFNNEIKKLIEEEKRKDLELLAKRLYVARTEERNSDVQRLGGNCYAPCTLQDCREEMGLAPKKSSDSL